MRSVGWGKEDGGRAERGEGDGGGQTREEERRRARKKGIRGRGSRLRTDLPWCLSWHLSRGSCRLRGRERRSGRERRALGVLQRAGW